MITLALFRKMVEEGVAGLIGDETNPKRNFYWEEVPLQSQGQPARGVWLITRPGNIERTRKGLNLRTTVDFYVAFKDKVKIEDVHQAIRRWLIDNRSICELKGNLGTTSYHYSNIRIQPTTTPQNSGATENGLFVKVASAEIIYDDNAQHTPPPLGIAIITENGLPITTENNLVLIEE